MSDRIQIKEDRYIVSYLVKNYMPPGSNEIKDFIVPDSQRKWAWNGKNGDKKKAFLVDSVINGYPIPTIIMNQTLSRKYEVYDGRHRIETLWLYVNGRFKWGGKRYADLTDLERDRFDRREIPVTIVDNATRTQLTDVFIRLNSGSHLKAYDYLWANRDTALICAVHELVCSNKRLAAVLGVDLETRADLANWTAIVAGLTTKDCENMTTSHIRLYEHYDVEVDSEYVTRGIDVLVLVFERAFEMYKVNKKDRKSFKKIGSFSAFFLTEWMDSDDKEATCEKWISIIGKLMGSDGKNMKMALTTSGAQNLNATKIKKVLRQVNDYLNKGITADVISDDDSEE
jgi:hypothetical protein